VQLIDNKQDSTFSRKYFGTVDLFETHADVIDNKEHVLSPNALKVLLVLTEQCNTGRIRKKNRYRKVEDTSLLPGYIKSRSSKGRIGLPVTLAVSKQTLMKLSGLSHDVIGSSLTELEEHQFIRKVGQDGNFDICNPRSGAQLVSSEPNPFIGTGVPYFRFPKALLAEPARANSVARMTASELKLYTVLCYLAGQRSEHEFDIKERKLRALCGFSRNEVMRKAMSGLEDKQLAEFYNGKVVLLDPLTGDDMYNDVIDPVYGFGERVPTLPSDIEVIRHLVESRRASQRTEDEVMLLCPFHDETTPSCSVSLSKGCFHCFGCGESGTLAALAYKLSGSEQRAIPAKRRTGPRRKPDAIYEYLDADGKLVKQVLRYPGKEFTQRRVTKDGKWSYRVSHLPPMLYKFPDVIAASTVIICEGEKDCDSLNELGLTDAEGRPVIATTSGGATSWADHLANSLTGKRVVVIGDDDYTGHHYAAEVAASLHGRGIEHGIHFLGSKDAADFLDQKFTDEDLVKIVGRGWLREQQAA
jgi:hypothetical protein